MTVLCQCCQIDSSTSAQSINLQLQKEGVDRDSVHLNGEDSVSASTSRKASSFFYVAATDLMHWRDKVHVTTPAMPALSDEPIPIEAISALQDSKAGSHSSLLRVTDLQRTVDVDIERAPSKSPEGTVNFDLPSEECRRKSKEAPSMASSQDCRRKSKEAPSIASSQFRSERSTASAIRQRVLGIFISLRPSGSERSCVGRELSRWCTMYTVEETSCEAHTVFWTLQLLPGGSLSTRQGDWCTPDVVRRYLEHRGEPRRAAAWLAKALQFRQEHEGVLSGERMPMWAGDMRVLVRASSGHPIIYSCFRHQARCTVDDFIDHVAAVLEAAVQKMEGNATTFDFVLDCHGFQLMKNLDPRPIGGVLGAVKHAYFGRLREALIVDAPQNSRMLWKVARGVINPNVRNQIHFLSSSEALDHLRRLDVDDATVQVVQDVMVRNRTGKGVIPKRQPSEVD